MRNTGFARGLRQSSTLAERRLWDLLRGRKLAGAKFRRQAPAGRYIADFLCADARLILELDGGIHEGREVQDETRQRELEAFGFHVLRFTNEQVLGQPGQVLEQIAAALRLARA